MTNVIDLPVITTLDLPPSRVLEAAIEADLQDAIVVGYDAEGEFYFAASKADGGDVLWLLELAKKQLLETIEYTA